MPAPAGPNISDSMLMTHAVITRALAVAEAAAGEFSAKDASAPDTGARSREGFAKYARCLTEVLDAHHQVEDEVVFPYFRDRIAQMPFDRLSAEHEEIEHHIAAVRDAGKAAEGAGPKETATLAEAVARAVAAITRIWQPHIRIEEHHLGHERLDPLLHPEENTRVAMEVGQASMAKIESDYLVIPFILYNLDPERRAAFSRALPPQVIEELVPVVWRPQWEEMSPYLLL